MKVILLNHVIKNNVIDGKLQPGNYNVAYDGVMSFAPMYRMFDGEKWEGEGEGERAMTVFVRDGDYVSDVKGICYELFGEYIREHFTEVAHKVTGVINSTHFTKLLYVKLEDNILKFTDKRDINFELDNTKLGLPLIRYIKDGLYKVEYYENLGSYTNPENRLYLRDPKAMPHNFNYRLTIHNKIHETVIYSGHEYQYPALTSNEAYSHLRTYSDGYALDTYNLKHEKIDEKKHLEYSVNFTFNYDVFDGEHCWEGTIDGLPEIKEYGDTVAEVKELLWDTFQIIREKKALDKDKTIE